MSEEQTLPDIPDLVAPKFEVSPHPYDIALVIDDTVFQIMNVDGQHAAQFMSQPRFVRVNPGDYVKIGWKYVDGKFVYPENTESQGY